MHKEDTNHDFCFQGVNRCVRDHEAEVLIIEMVLKSKVVYAFILMGFGEVIVLGLQMSFIDIFKKTNNLSFHPK